MWRETAGCRLGAQDRTVRGSQRGRVSRVCRSFRIAHYSQHSKTKTKRSLGLAEPKRSLGLAELSSLICFPCVVLPSENDQDLGVATLSILPNTADLEGVLAPALLLESIVDDPVISGCLFMRYGLRFCWTVWHDLLRKAGMRCLSSKVFVKP